MGRLVDTDDLEKGLRELMKRNGVKSFYSTSFDAIDFETLIDEAPTVDAEPMRHGCEYCAGKRVEYQQTKSTKLYIDTHGNTRALVTECNRCPPYARCSMNGIPILAAFPINYCPNCGAKMGAEESNVDE